MSISYKNMLAFVTLAQHKSFAEAAQALCVSQPALSTAIKNMEQQLGGQLLSRSTRKVTLTPEGKRFLPTAKRLIDDWNNATNDVKASFDVKTGQLSIAAMPSFAENILPLIVNRFHNQYPSINLRVYDVVMEDVIDNVMEERAEIGFIFEPKNTEQLEYHELSRDPFCIVCKPSHPITSKPKIAFSDVLEFPQIAMNVGSGIRAWLDEVTEQVGVKPNIIAETHQFGTLGQFVNHSVGEGEHALAIVPKLCREQMKAKGLETLEITTGELEKSVGYITKQNRILSSAAKALLSCC